MLFMYISIIIIVDTVKQLCEPAVMVFDLNRDLLVDKYVLGNNVLKESSVLTSVVCAIISY